MSAYTRGDPFSIHGDTVARGRAVMRRWGQLRAQAAHKGVFPLPHHRLVRGDPSWLSNWLKKPLKPLIGLGEVVGGALTANPALIAAGGATLVATGKGTPAKAAPRPNPAIASTYNSMRSVSPSTLSSWMSFINAYKLRRVAKRGGPAYGAFRNPASSVQGRAAGAMSALAPAPMGVSIFRGDIVSDLSGLAGMFGGGDDGSGIDLGSVINDASDLSGLAGMFGGGGGGSPAVTGTGMTPVTSSSGMGGMLAKHFFGNSHSRAIPISQTNGVRPRGFHPNKHGYFLSSIATWIQPGTVWVPNRRRNPLNPRALHKSMARLISAKHAVKKLGLLDVPRRHHSRQRKYFPVRRAPKLLKAG